MLQSYPNESKESIAFYSMRRRSQEVTEHGEVTRRKKYFLHDPSLLYPFTYAIIAQHDLSYKIHEIQDRRFVQ